MKIPESLFSLFWEYEPEKIDTYQHASLIMSRIMERGRWTDMVWLLNTYSRNELVDFLEKRGKNILPPRELNYWAFISNLPPEIRHEWIKSARERKDEWRTRYSHKHTTGEPEKIIT